MSFRMRVICFRRSPTLFGLMFGGSFYVLLGGRFFFAQAEAHETPPSGRSQILRASQTSRPLKRSIDFLTSALLAIPSWGPEGSWASLAGMPLAAAPPC